MGWRAVRATVPVGTGTGYCTLEVQTSSGWPSAVGQLGEIVVTGATVEGSYHTGDLGRRTPDGDVEVCGRIDRQLLVGGHRVEPASVEAVLTGLTGIAGAAVGLHPESSDTLIALVVLVPAQRPALDRIRCHLRRALPAWSVPEVIEVEAIPLTRNGKPDLSTLPSVSPLQGRNGEHTTAPATGSQKLEVLIGDVVRDLCGHDVGPDQQFFDAGLNSMDIVRLHRRLRQLIDDDIDAAELFQFPTIRSLANHLTAACSAVPTAGLGLLTETELQARRAARNAVRFL